MKIFALTMGFLLFVSNSYTQNNYFVTSQGNDSNSGTSETSAWKTIAKVNSMNFLPGDVVSFKSEQIFADEILICKAGVEYNTYGGNLKAIIGDNLKNLTVATIQITSENVTLENLKIFGYLNASAVITYTKGGLIIRNCEISGGNNSHLIKTIGIKCSASNITKKVHITRNIIKNLDKGLYLTQPYNIEISFNRIHNIFRYDGYQNVGGIGIQAGCGNLEDAFDCKYTFHIHHNEIFNFEHSAMYVGSVSRVLVEYNYIHDNLDERLYMGGIKHGTVGKFYDNTGQTTGSLGNIFRYNYVYNIQRRGLPGYTYGRPTIENIKAGIPKIINSNGSNVLANYITAEGDTFFNIPDAVLSGLGYGNVWIHNNIFYKSTHQVYTRGYTKFDPLTGKGGNGKEGLYRADLISYFINNTVIDYGNSSITNSTGIIYTEVTSASPVKVINNVMDLDNPSALMAGYFKEKGDFVDHNIYITRGGTARILEDGEKYATYFPNNDNAGLGKGEQYFTVPNFNSSNGYIFVSEIGVNGVYMPDFRLTNIGSATNFAMDYDLIGDTYIDNYGRHILGKDPTSRSFAYDILGNLRTTNDIGAFGTDNLNRTAGLIVILEASYEQGIMKTSLNSLGFLPKNQPYNVHPWNVNDTSTLSNGSENYVDWILVQLKDNLTNVKYSKAGILTKNGIVVNPDGSAFSFSNILSGDYYIVLSHRNHLAVMNSEKIRINNGETLIYDFTDTPNKAYGDNAMADLGDGKYGMYSGDSDANGIVNVLDYGCIGNFLFQSGYQVGDLDLNGVVNVLDFQRTNRNLLINSKAPGSVLINIKQ